MDGVPRSSSARQVPPAPFIDLPFSWVGEFIFDKVCKGVGNIYDAVQKVMQKWGTDFVVHRILSLMVLLNPRLSPRHQARLMSVVRKAVDEVFRERYYDRRLMRGIVALASLNQDTGPLFHYLVEVVDGLVYNRDDSVESAYISSACHVDSPCSDSTQGRPHPPSCDSNDLEDRIVLQVLSTQFHMEKMYLAAMPSNVRKAVLGALNGGMPLSNVGVNHQQPSPICCITLEPLLSMNGAITADVVAVMNRSKMTGKSHAFLYRGKALFDWLGHSQIPTHPETRSLVLPTDIHRLSS